MATITSIASGYWSDPNIWDSGTVPADGDTVTVAAGHVVTFDVDQSGFSTGLAGLTINGTLKIPSQAEDSNMPNFVCLKVNANIAGTGSLLVGSSTYPITYPQSAKIMANGSITVTTFNCYGEQRWPAFDYLAQDAPAGATQIVLTEGMPLRAGDVLAIGRSDVNSHWTSGDNFSYTVTAYDPQTKTATISPALVRARRGGFPYGCLVILLTRQIVLSKYGSNNVTLVSGSGRTLVGVQFTSESGATFHSHFGVSNLILSYSSGGHYLTYLNASNLTIDHSVFYCYGGLSPLRDPSGTVTLQHIALLNTIYGIFWCINISTTSINITNLHSQNMGQGVFFSSGYGSHPLIFVDETYGIIVKYSSGIVASFHAPNATGPYRIVAKKVLGVNCGFLIGSAPGRLFAEISNVTIYCDNTNFQIGTTANGLMIKDVNVNIASDRSVTVVNSVSPNIILQNINIQGAGTGVLGQGGQIFNCSIQNAGNPLASSAGSPTIVRNLSVNAYNRPTLDTTYLTSDNRKFIFYDISGLTVAGNSYPKARERIWNYGYVKNAWDDATPNYDTWRWYLTNTSLAAPMYLDYRLMTSDPIKVTGTISQLASGDVVKVQIFRATKEPLLGDTPDYERTYTSTGSINVSWTPTEVAEWVVRIQVEMQQTSSPTEIQNLVVSAGGEGGGGGVVGEPSLVFMG